MTPKKTAWYSKCLAKAQEEGKGQRTYSALIVSRKISRFLCSFCPILIGKVKSNFLAIFLRVQDRKEKTCNRWDTLLPRSGGFLRLVRLHHFFGDICHLYIGLSEKDIKWLGSYCLLSEQITQPVDA